MPEAYYSIEVLPSLVLRNPGLSATLEGLEVFLPLLDRRGFDEQLQAAELLSRNGAIPVPHIVARTIRDQSELHALVEALDDVGCRRFLLLAGSKAQPEGAIPDSLALLDQLPCDHPENYHRLYFAAHPDGLEDVAKENLLEALQRKQEWCLSRGIQPSAVTQFRLSPNAPDRWLRELRQHAIEFPVRLGMAGPCDIRKLLRYGQRCGLLNAGRGARVLLPHLPGLLRGWSPPLPDQIEATWDGLHIYPFGGVEGALAWVKGGG